MAANNKKSSSTYVYVILAMDTVVESDHIKVVSTVVGVYESTLRSVRNRVAKLSKENPKKHYLISDQVIEKEK
jgi:hypothetical protein